MPGRRVLRVIRRRSAWEGTVSEVVSVEFRDARANRLDLSPSVYLVDEGEGPVQRAAAIRIVTEHRASFIGPPRPNSGTSAIDVDGATTALLEPTLGGTAFVFANEAHAELRLADEAALHNFVEVLVREFAQRQIEISAEESMSHALARLDAGDPEWRSAMDVDVKDWVVALEKWRRTRPRSGP